MKMNRIFAYLGHYKSSLTLTWS